MRQRTTALDVTLKKLYKDVWPRVRARLGPWAPLAPPTTLAGLNRLIRKLEHSTVDPKGPPILGAEIDHARALLYSIETLQESKSGRNRRN